MTLRPVRFVTIQAFALLTGYSEKAIEKKIDDKVWMEGRHYRRAPDGRRLIDLEGFERWVEKGV